ncbi:aldehyde dehydrogenase family protein [Bradyrhizobium sp. LTSPM299]|jgi:succinate-semialdehyde dehydrogenase / glutarate-semialdehyde dehydrogenase|uniref:aldehyde dehydrogenase family protein n=1 Tax=Bradyrhizobium sp. LTSPM299 TaxID=1619233 RepID=UPI0012E2B4E6|nr:aldehyde dehydrogenase family protein [Bradyrhizobium sp. LTSPM299]
MISKLALKDLTLLSDACLIEGEWAVADSGHTIVVNNPSTGAVIGTVPEMGVAETRRAIEFANAALPAWRARR